MQADTQDMKTLVEALQKNAAPVVVNAETRHFAFVPEGMSVVSLEQFQDAEPKLRKQGRVEVFDVSSFAAYFNRFADEDSLIFGSPEKVSFTGVIDYHREKEGEARPCKHLVYLKLRETERWLTWKGANKKPMEQAVFAQFIEDNRADIYAPDGSNYPASADMVEIARTLEATGGFQFAQATNLKTGERRISYVEATQATAGPSQSMTIPDEFIVRIPIFLNQPPVEVRCRLRFRISGGKLSMWFDMIRVDEMLNEEFTKAAAAVEKLAGRPVLLATVGS